MKRSKLHRRQTQRNQIVVVTLVSIVFILVACNAFMQLLNTGNAISTPAPQIIADPQQTVVKEDPMMSARSIQYKAELQFLKGHTTAKVNLRTEPSTSCKVIEVLPAGYNVTYAPYNEEWYQIQKENTIAYLHKNYVEDGSIDYTPISISSSGFKSFMDYRAITSTSSIQYRIQNHYAHTGKFGIRQVKGRFCVALGSAVNANMGTYVDLVLENGTIINCILSDQKADIHTLDDNLTTAANGCVSEFIVDTGSLESLAAAMGDISYSCEEWQSPVVEIRICNSNIFD